MARSSPAPDGEAVQRCLEKASRDLRAAAALVETWEQRPPGLLAELLQAELAIMRPLNHVLDAGRRS